MVICSYARIVRGLALPSLSFDWKILALLHVSSGVGASVLSVPFFFSFFLSLGYSSTWLKYCWKGCYTSPQTNKPYSVRKHRKYMRHTKTVLLQCEKRALITYAGSTFRKVLGLILSKAIPKISTICSFTWLLELGRSIWIVHLI